MSEENRPPDPYAGGVPPEPGQPAPYPQPTTPPGYGAPPGYPPAYGPPQPYAAYPATPSSSNNAVIALVLAILSWVLCPLVLAVVALPFAAKAKAEIEESNGWVTGDGMVTAAKVVAWINIALYLCILAGVVVVMIIAAVSSTR